MTNLLEEIVYLKGFIYITQSKLFFFFNIGTLLFDSHFKKKEKKKHVLPIRQHEPFNHVSC